MNAYNFRIGETIRLPLLLVSGNKNLVSNLRATMKFTTKNRVVPALSVPADAIGVITSTEDGWLVEIGANVTAGLKPGFYALNVAMDVAGTTVITEAVFVKLERSTIT